MNDNDRKVFFERISDIYSFYRKDYSAFAGNVWWAAMKPFDLDAVTDALNRHCINPDNGQFLPMPADVVRMLQGSTQDSALVAWSKVDRSVRTIGTYESVVFDDPLIHRVVSEMGGWVALGMKSDEEWPFQRNEFVNRYRGYRGRSQIPEYPPVLVGIAEAANCQNNIDHDIPPILIGIPRDAENVFYLGSNSPLLGFTRLKPKDTANVIRLADTRKAG